MQYASKAREWTAANWGEAYASAVSSSRRDWQPARPPSTGVPQSGQCSFTGPAPRVRFLSFMRLSVPDRSSACPSVHDGWRGGLRGPPERNLAHLAAALNRNSSPLSDGGTLEGGGRPCLDGCWPRSFGVEPGWVRTPWGRLVGHRAQRSGMSDGAKRRRHMLGAAVERNSTQSGK
jgi:hypothetical protein